MITKAAGFLLKIIAVLFTSLVAPVLVHVIVQNGTTPASKPCFCDQKAAKQEEVAQSSHSCAVPLAPTNPVEQASLASPPPMQLTPEITRIVVQGVGRTPADASQNALRTAVQTALAAQVGPDTWTRSGQLLFEHILRNSEGIILGWKELRASREWKLRGTVHHAEVAVEVNMSLLAQRLRAVPIPGTNGYPQGWHPVGSPTQTTACVHSRP